MQALGSAVMPKKLQRHKLESIQVAKKLNRTDATHGITMQHVDISISSRWLAGS